MFNKKAQKTKLIFGFLVLTVIIIIGFSSIFPGITDGLGGIFKLGDDAIDGPCRCGWPTENNYEEVEHEGILYCVKSRSTCTEEQQQSIYQTIQYRRIQGMDPVPLCVYTQSDCEEKK